MKVTLTLDADKMHFGPRALMSEKFDGIQGRWDGKRLTTREGKPIVAPAWFTKELPKGTPLVGELWMGNGTFETCQSVILAKSPDARWWAVQFMIFEGGRGLREGKRVRFVEQRPARNVRAFAERIIAGGGEGVVVRDGKSIYKVKACHDAEVRVVGYEGGTGRNAGLVGALIVATPSGATFKLGAGLSDAVRRTPPALGALVTYAFDGVTAKGMPRGARFIRERMTA